VSGVVLLSVGWGALVASPLVVAARRRGARDRITHLRGERGERGARRRADPLHLVGRAGALGRVVIGLATRPRRRAAAAEVARAVPLTLDVVIVALRAGYAARPALAAAAPWCPVAVIRDLEAVESRCRLGAPFAVALAHLTEAVAPFRTLAEVLALTDHDGAPAADRLAALAVDARAELRRRAEAHARRLTVRLLFPLVFLVLPAFGLLTVVPTLSAGLRGI